MPEVKHTTKPNTTCPYCLEANIAKAGKRHNKYGAVQTYLCRSCKKKFTPLYTKRTTYPLPLIIECLSLYNRGYTLEEAARRIGKKYSLPLSKQLVGSWKQHYAEYFPYFRLRADIASQAAPHELITETRLQHGQVYDYRYHRGKTNHLLTDDKNGEAYHRLQAYLEGVPTDTPHDLFRRDAPRASQTKNPFSLNEVAITPRQNKAVDMARFVLQTVTNNYKRHPTLQSFMLENDAVTIAVEVPIVLTPHDLAHYREKLGFRIPFTLSEDAALTGHIDILQIRNGAIQILDYKPGAKKDKPVEQLMIYALALSRLTMIPLYSFKCAWFDDEHYYEFYPLNVVHKKKDTNKHPAPRKT